MKKYFAIIILMAIIITTNVFGQEYGICFTNPEAYFGMPDPLPVTGTPVDGDFSSLTVSYVYNGVKSNPQNSWKIKISTTCGGQQKWVDEGVTSVNLNVRVKTWGTLNAYLYEAAPNTPENQWIYRTSCQINIQVFPTVYIVNNFGSGEVNVGGINYNSGYQCSELGYDVTAITQQVDNEGYTRVWNTSSDNPSSWKMVRLDGVQYKKTSSIGFYYSYSSGDNGGVLTAELRKECELSFEDIYVTANGYMYSPGSIIKTIEGVPISVTASLSQFESADYMLRQFASWNDGSTSLTKSFVLSGHDRNISVNTIPIRPTNGYKNMSYAGVVADYITVNWNEHPNNGVTKYNIYRSIKNIPGERLLGYVNRGTTSFTDYDYKYTAGYTDDMIFYDVRAFYEPNGSYADVDYQMVYGKFQPDFNIKDDKSISTAFLLPAEYNLKSYPNPFNPTTVIRYALPEAGQVSLKVYNILSQEVANLVDETKSAGIHTVNFNANNLPTGIYIARLQAGSKVMSIKLQLVK